MKTYIQPGETMDFTSAGAVASGAVVVVGSILGVAVAATTGAGQTLTLRVQGVVEVPKTAAQAWSEGALLYWSGTAFTTTVTGSARGCAARSALAADTVGIVRLNGTAA